MDPGPIFYILLQTPAAILCLLFLATPTIFHTVLLILCFCKTGEIDNLSVSSWAKFWFVSVQVPRCWRGERHLPATALFRCHPSPTGSITLGRNSRETCCCLHHNLPLGVNQLVAITCTGNAPVNCLEASTLFKLVCRA